jgi:hypothetical protein
VGTGEGTAAEEETCGEARALESPVEVAAAIEETCTFGKAAAADTAFGQTAAADTEDAPETLRTLCEEDAPALGLG